uniref:Uncharacterized protein n=1 Tax=Acrobeloides nanus TaxID=290746 RepID=A0A914DHD6_9BILA
MILEERIRVQIDGDFKCQCYLCELDRSDPFIPKREAFGEKIETINQQYAQSNSQQAIKLIEPLVDKLRQTYQKRKELQTHLYIPLNIQAKLYYSMKQYEKAAELLKEFDEKINEFKVVQSSNMGIEAMILLSKCYELARIIDLTNRHGV